MESDFLVELDQDHPGFRDPEYRQQRDLISRLAQEFLDARESGGDPEIPIIQYEQHQQQLWKHIFAKISAGYETYAVYEVEEGLRALNLDPEKIPCLLDVNASLEAKTGWRVIPVTGLVSSRFFFSSLVRSEFYCTQYIRHHSHPEFTPEPDICHDVLGHVPLLMVEKIAQTYLDFSLASQKAPSSRIKELENLYWFTFEYGLCYEDGQIKTYGAGNLSSYADLQRCVDPARVQHMPFDIEKMCRTNYDPTIQQPLLFLAPSLDAALSELSEFLRKEFQIS